MLKDSWSCKHNSKLAWNPNHMCSRFSLRLTIWSGVECFVLYWHNTPFTNLVGKMPRIFWWECYLDKSYENSIDRRGYIFSYGHGTWYKAKVTNKRLRLFGDIWHNGKYSCWSAKVNIHLAIPILLSIWMMEFWLFAPSDSGVYSRPYNLQQVTLWAPSRHLFVSRVGGGLHRPTVLLVIGCGTRALCVRTG